MFEFSNIERFFDYKISILRKSFVFLYSQHIKVLKKFIKSFKDYFDFSNAERKGLFVLVALIFIVFILKALLPFIFKEKNEITPEIIKVSRLQKCIDSLDKIASTKYSFKQRQINPFPFNPSQLPESKWKQLGFDEHQIKIIKNYELKGGKFRFKEDVKKIYGIRPEEYQMLEPYILLPNKEEMSTRNWEKKKINPIEINSADSLQWLKLPGIGPAYSARIIKYRNKLGGFARINQLLEVYGMDSARYNSIKPYLIININLIKKINVNKSSINELMKCPYIDMLLAKSIVNTRSYKGYYKKNTDLKNIKLMYDDIYYKIEPYITVE